MPFADFFVAEGSLDIVILFLPMEVNVVISAVHVLQALHKVPARPVEQYLARIWLVLLC